jgi:hypothetical protein
LGFRIGIGRLRKPSMKRSKLSGTPDDSIGLGMGTDPEPDEIVVSLHSQCSVAESDASRPEPAGAVKGSEGCLGSACGSAKHESANWRTFSGNR